MPKLGRSKGNRSTITDLERAFVTSRENEKRITPSTLLTTCNASTAGTLAPGQRRDAIDAKQITVYK